jgi:hypothetical protein
MIKEFNFSNVIRTMTASQVVMKLVEGVREPVGRLYSKLSGHVVNGDRCASLAVSAICKIADVSWVSYRFGCEDEFCESFGSNNEAVVMMLEQAYKHLAMGNIKEYNYWAYKLFMPMINANDCELPNMYFETYPSDIEAYEEFAKKLERKREQNIQVI